MTQVAVCWFVSNRAEGPIFALLNTPLMKQVILVLSEIFRANSVCGIVVLSNSILKVRGAAGVCDDAVEGVQVVF